jgi:galacturan 1,4-alpha-galacturonidase
MVDGAFLSNTENGVRIKTWQVVFFTNIASLSLSLLAHTSTESGVDWILVFLYLHQGGSGYATEISFQNVLMENVSNPIIIDQYYCDSRQPCANQVRLD